MKLLKSPISGLLALILAGSPALAAVKMPAIFGDHMVLQRDGAVPVWGWAEPGEAITVTAGGAVARATAGPDGKWMAKLPSLTRSETPIEVAVAGKSNTLTFHDVLVGDVWLCSGQSNMEFNTGRASNAAEALPKADHPEIRFFLVANRAVRFNPQDDCQGKWEVCTPATAKKFSAVGYFFADQIAAAEKTPVGLIGSYVPGSAAPPWISVEPLLADPELEKKYARGYEKLSANFDALKIAHDQWQKDFGDDYTKALGHYYPLRNKAKQEGLPEPTPPPKPAVPEPFFPKPPSFFYNGMIAPVIPYALKGVLWYQGESNAGDELYSKLFSALIRDWRSRWGQGDFPFLFVQLPNYGLRTNEPAQKQDGRDSGWVVVREAQLATLKTVPATGMAVTIDVGDGANLHPLNKIDVANRLARIARHVAYGEDLVFSGPIYDSFTINGGKVVIKFKWTGTGLKMGAPPAPASLSGTIPVTTPAMAPASELKGFAIAGADKKFVWAKAAIESPDTVTVWSDEVKQPVAVRYGWAENPETNLYNSADLPASPFRTEIPVSH